MEPRKQAIMTALDRFVAQRPRLEFGNYGDVKAYRAEMRSITRDRHDYNALARAVERSDSITADMLVKAAESAFSGRLTITLAERERLSEYTSAGGNYFQAPAPATEPVAAINYCAGQYFPTEYRKAACAVLASALWQFAFSDITQERAKDSQNTFYRDASPGDAVRRHFRREFGWSIAKRWFS